jgi:hypothetical protein
MKRYRNLGGDSGVTGYRVGDGLIHVRFVDGDIYEYTDLATGHEHVEHMQSLAQSGRGLATYISRFVHGTYARKLH